MISIKLKNTSYLKFQANVDTKTLLTSTKSNHSYKQRDNQGQEYVS